jgi:AraC family transcriptional regulator
LITLFCVHHIWAGTDTLANYQQRLFELLDYIDSHLDQTLSTENLSQAAYLSRFHFHRQFAALFGVNVGSYLKSLRFKQAAHLLAYRPEVSITEISMRSSYESSEAFSRAFKQFCQLTPSEFRQSPDWFLLKQQENWLNQIRSISMKNSNMEYQVEMIDFPEIALAKLEHKAAPHLLGNSIRRFIEWRKENRVPPSISRTFNLVYADPESTPDEEFQFDLAAEYNQPVKPNSQGVTSSFIPAGLCARICHQGSDAGLAAAVNYLYRDWLLDSGCELRDFPLFFERVSFYPDVPESERITHIYLPLKEA